MKDKLVTITFVLFLGLFFILSIFLPDIKISNAERRKMAQFPNITMSSILNKKNMNDLDKYLEDQFPLREKFKGIDTSVKFNFFSMSDIDNLYISDGYIIKQEYPLNSDMLKNYINKVNYICSNYLEGMDVYHVIIPDKNYYSHSNLHLKMDYSSMFYKIKNDIKSVKHIDIYDLLDLDCYYNSDIHWKQEKLIPIKNRILKVMKNYISNDNLSNYIENRYYPFYGSYYGELLSSNVPLDTIKYLSNDVIDNAHIDNIEKSKVTSVYDIDELSNIDSYSVFLSGPSAFITIYNDNSKNSDELVIFRDSFASSLIPLFIENYSKITLIDIRYIDMKNVVKLIEFKDQDVLFLYSTFVINNSNILKQ